MTRPPRTLVVHAHPLAESFNVALLDRVVAALDAAGHAPEIARLYDGADPSPLGATSLVAVYPTWWSGLPAILLDWVQRHIGPWLDRQPDAGPSPLRTVERLVAVTTHGSSKLVNVAQGEPGLRHWRRAILPLCGLDARFAWIALYDTDRTTPADRAAFLDRAARDVVTSVAAPARPRSGRTPTSAGTSGW